MWYPTSDELIQAKVLTGSINPAKKQVRIISESSEGLRQADMDSSFLKRFESLITSRIKIKTMDALNTKGATDMNVKVNSSSRYLSNGKIKLALLHINQVIGSTSTEHVVVAGFKDGQFIQVACSGVVGNPASLSDKECSDKINDIFGVSEKIVFSPLP